MSSLVATLLFFLLPVTGLPSLNGKHRDAFLTIQELPLINVPIRVKSYPQVNVRRWRETILQGKLHTYMKGTQAIKHGQELSKDGLEIQKTELKKQFEIKWIGTKQHVGKKQSSHHVILGEQKFTDTREEEALRLRHFQRHVQGSQKTERERRMWMEMKDDGRPNFNDVIPILMKRSLATGAENLNPGRPETRRSTPKTGEARPKSNPRPKSGSGSKLSSRPKSSLEQSPSEPSSNSSEHRPKTGQSSSGSSFSSKVKHSIQFITGPIAKASQKIANPILKTKRSFKADTRRSVTYEDTLSNGLTSGYARKPSNTDKIWPLDNPEQNRHIEEFRAPTQEELDLLNQQRSPPKCFETRAHFDFINSHSKNWEEWSYREDQNFAQTHGNPPPLDPNQTQQNGPKGYRAFATKPPSPRTNTLNAQQLSQQLVLGKEKEDIQNFITKNQNEWAKFHKSPPREEKAQMSPALTVTAKKPPVKSSSRSSSPATSDDESQAESPDQSQCRPVRLLNSVASSNQLPSAKHLRTPPNLESQPQPPIKKLSNRKINERFGALLTRVRSTDKSDEISQDQNENPPATAGNLSNAA